jgi:membrane protease YdiL (CAAX protease family)
VIQIETREKTVFKSFLTHWFKTDLAVAVLLFCLLTVVRFVAEHIPPLWFPLLIAYAALPLLTVPRRNWPQIGLRRPAAWQPILVGAVAAILVKAITIFALFAWLDEHPANWMMGVAQNLKDMPTHPPSVIGIIIFFMIGAPIVEEIFFRTLQSAWQARHGTWHATIATALLFAFSHIEQYLIPFSFLGILTRFIPISIYGLVHARAYQKTGSTYSSVITHLVGNAAEALLLTLFILPRL